VDDLIREFLVNPDSENSSLYTENERNELIFQLFQLLVIGGALCQADVQIDRYLHLTKAIYKELVTVYRSNNSNSTNEILVAGKAFRIRSINGIELFPENPISPYNVCLVILDPLKKHLHVVKNTFKNFW
jgi:cilia- and flagella-associated protein 300